LADLFVELVLFGVGLLAHLFATVAEDVRQAGQRLLLPSTDLRRVDAEDLRNLGGCLVRLDGLHSNFGLQAGRVILACSWHCLSFIFNAADHLRKDLFRVQILGSITGYVFKKEAHKLPAEANDESIGDAYTFVAIERGSKLVLNFALGRRSQATTDIFIEGLRHATAHCRFQISTDGFQPYVSAITTTLSDRCDFAQLVKVYAQAPEEERRRYSPPEVTNAEKVPVMGNPDPAKICTSHIERQNLTMRMHMRRLTRLTNAFSKKWDNLWAALCLHFAWYNFVRVHQTLRVTPAMQAGITGQPWEIGDLIGA